MIGRFIRVSAGCSLSVAALVAVTGVSLGLEPDELFRALQPEIIVAAHPRFPQTPSSAPEPATPMAEIKDPEWFLMTQQLARMADAYRGKVGVYVRDMNSGQEWAYNGDVPFASASLVKVPIMYSVFRKVADGDLTLSKRLTLRRRDRIGGSGHLKWFRDGSQFTVREMLLRMMRDSDNTAMNMLLREVGLGYVQKTIKDLGLVHTYVHQEGLSLRAGTVRAENYTTAKELGSFLEKMHRGELIDAFSSQMMLELMSQGRSRTRLSKRLPVGWQIAHKTGLLRKACHDVGLVTTPKGSFLISVLTGDNRDYPTAKEFISRVGYATFAYYQGDYGLHARARSPYSAAQAAR